MAKIINKKNLVATGVFLLLVGLALILTFIFMAMGDSFVEGEYKGFFFSGAIAMFIGLFFVLLKGFKTIYATIIASVAFLLTLTIYMSVNRGGSAPTEEIIMEEHVEESVEEFPVDSMHFEEEPMVEEAVE